MQYDSSKLREQSTQTHGAGTLTTRFHSNNNNKVHIANHCFVLLRMGTFLFHHFVFLIHRALLMQD